MQMVEMPALNVADVQTVHRHLADECCVSGRSRTSRRSRLLVPSVLQQLGNLEFDSKLRWYDFYTRTPE